MTRERLGTTALFAGKRVRMMNGDIITDTIEDNSYIDPNFFLSGIYPIITH